MPSRTTHFDLCPVQQLLNMLTNLNTMTALSRLLSGDRHAPINLRSEMTDTMADLSRLFSGD
jgi:hypothetical protein